MYLCMYVYVYIERTAQYSIYQIPWPYHLTLLFETIITCSSPERSLLFQLLTSIQLRFFCPLAPWLLYLFCRHFFMVYGLINTHTLFHLRFTILNLGLTSNYPKFINNGTGTEWMDPRFYFSGDYCPESIKFFEYSLLRNMEWICPRSSFLFVFKF